MAQAIAHFLISAIVVSVFRDFYLKNKQRKKFPLHYVLLAGIGGILPDFDIGVYWMLKILGYNQGLESIHRHYTHIFLIPLLIVILSLVVYSIKDPTVKCWRNHELRLSIILFVLSIGWLIHILIDLLLTTTQPFIPFYTGQFGLNIESLFKIDGYLFEAVIDAIFFTFWIVYLEFKHKISDFI